MTTFDRLNRLLAHVGEKRVVPSDVYSAGAGEPYKGMSKFLKVLDIHFKIDTGGHHVGTRLTRLEEKAFGIGREDLKSTGTYFWLGAG